MPSRCVVALCPNRNPIEGKELSYFSFPKDRHKRQLWINFCQKGSKFNPTYTSRICSAHFNESDFMNLTQIRLMGGRLRLYKSAIPSRRIEMSCVTSTEIHVKEEQEVDSVHLQLVSGSQVKNISNTRVTSDTPTIYCCITTCENHTEPAKNEDLPRFFNFPVDPIMHAKWIKKCRLEEPLRGKRICSKHFESSDFKGGTITSALDYHPRRLSKTAIPSLFLSHTEKTVSDIEENEDFNQESAIGDDSLKILHKKCKRSIFQNSEEDKEHEHMRATSKKQNTNQKQNINQKQNTNQKQKDDSKQDQVTYTLVPVESLEFMQRLQYLEEENSTLRSQLEEMEVSKTELEHRLMRIEKYIKPQKKVNVHFGFVPLSDDLTIVEL